MSTVVPIRPAALPLRPLRSQLHELDLLIADEVGYAQVWLSYLQEVATVMLLLEHDGREVIETGIRADEHDLERVERRDALHSHLNSAGHRGAVIRLLRARGDIFRRAVVR